MATSVVLVLGVVQFLLSDFKFPKTFSFHNRS